MKKSFEIIEFYKGSKSSFYTIKFEGELKSETDKFLEKYKEIEEEKIENLVERILLMAERNSCQDFYFKMKESSIYNNICALWEEDLRLFCLRFGNVAVVLNGGGIKDKNSYQEVPELDKIVK